VQGQDVLHLGLRHGPESSSPTDPLADRWSGASREVVLEVTVWKANDERSCGYGAPFSSCYARCARAIRIANSAASGEGSRPGVSSRVLAAPLAHPLLAFEVRSGPDQGNEVAETLRG
jgi:hypothetical protein